MSEQEKKEKKVLQKDPDMDRRELLKGLATLPAIAAFFVSLWAKLRRDAIKKSNLLQDLVKKKQAPAIVSSTGSYEHLRIGV
ncbi:uncharacterized protein METZ01_LOCUS342851, partial [marine metagenome]